MELDKLKLRRLCEAKRLKARVARTSKTLKGIQQGNPKASRVKTTKVLTTNEKGSQIYASQPTIGGAAKEAVEDDVNLDEGKRPHTPEFVRHCVTAITEKPKELARVESGAPEGTDGSPFGICWAKYKGNKSSLAAKHSKGEHHTDSQYKKALATLREDVEEARRQNAGRSRLMFSDVEVSPTAANRHLIRFVPRG